MIRYFTIRVFNQFTIKAQKLYINWTVIRNFKTFNYYKKINNNNIENYLLKLNSSKNIYKMGSINCKEYATTRENSNNKKNDDPMESYQAKTCDDGTLVETIVCNESDLQENEMKEMSIDEDTKILLIKQNGKFSAIGTECSHYAAPLEQGALGQGRVRCPWHGACFNIETGDIEDFPGLDSIPCYKVRVCNNGEVRVTAKRANLADKKRVKDMSRRCKEDNRVFVIIGGGPAGGVCAETLRQDGFGGRIVMICKENALPYDRVTVSKTMDAALKDIEFREKKFYDEYNIETLIGVEATKVDTLNKIVACSNDMSLKYDKLFIASGTRAFKPDIPGTDLEGVFTLRNHEDAKAINEKFTVDSNVVCLGSSFIALEAAAYFSDKAKSVTLIGRGKVPVENVFGIAIGEQILNLFQEKNVKMIMSSEIKECFGEDGKIVEVEIANGSKIPCDILIMGTGVVCNTEFLKDSGISLNANGSINADLRLRANAPDIFVGGDIANAPVFSAGNKYATIGHYQLAQYHGQMAALNMNGHIKEIQAIPFFWTRLFGKSIQYAGYGTAADIEIHGDVKELKFFAYYFNEEDYVIAMAACQHLPIVAKFAEYTAQGNRIHRDEIKENPLSWQTKKPCI